MAQSLGLAVINFSTLFQNINPDIVLLQGDRGEMLAGAIIAAHMNIPIVHMSGGDFSGSIDDSIRNAISKFSHIHLTTCESSSNRLAASGENLNRIFQVGEPGLDLIKNVEYIEPPELINSLELDSTQPIAIASLHPVTTEVEQAEWQMEQLLEAITALKLQTVFTYPNSDSGGKNMVRVLESYRGKDYIKIIPNLGSQKYLSLMKTASILIGNSSSGIWESPSFKLPVINIGTRQHNRLKAENVINVGYHKNEIMEGIQFALNNQEFKEKLASCINPYGDGTAAPQTIDILKKLKLTKDLVSKWDIKESKFLFED
jgi:UDP-N-acetylglucosamine 2-epimerase (non-hydrolysing)/GDP/UDP-N,N'-diacetylbacillosamine 2-epimerase (hydrolysing)